MKGIVVGEYPLKDDALLFVVADAQEQGKRERWGRHWQCRFFSVSDLSDDASDASLLCCFAVSPLCRQSLFKLHIDIIRVSLAEVVTRKRREQNFEMNNFVSIVLQKCKPAWHFELEP